MYTESTDKHVLYDKQAVIHIDRQDKPRIVTIDDRGFRHIFQKKNAACHLPSRKKHWPIWITDCVDWWFLCHLLLSLWADSVCVVQSEPEVSSQPHSLSIVAWNMHGAALATLSAKSMLIFSVSLPLLQMSLTVTITHHFHSLLTHSHTHSNTPGAADCKSFVDLISVRFGLKIPCGVFDH